MPLSKKDKIQIGVIVFVIILGILRVVQVAHRRTATPIALPAAQIQIETGNQTVPTTTSAFDVAASRTTNDQRERSKQRWGRDPFFGLPIEDSAFEQPLPNSSSGELVLSGISLKGKRAMAIVNRTIVREGDEVFGMKVLAIERDRVVFAQNSHEVILRFGGVQ